MKPEKYWWERPFRMVQTNFREIDMADIDPDAFAESLEDLGASAVMLNAGGIIACYDTKIREHVVNPCLRDVGFGDLAEACRKRGIRVVARMDFSKVRYALYEEHPEYAYRSARGDIINYNGNVTSCPSSDYQRVIAPKIVREVCERFPIDGMYFNMSGFKTSDYSYRRYGFCHCDACRKLFREYSGYDLPDSIEESSPLYETYMRFTEKVSGENRQRIREVIKSVNPAIAVDKMDFYRIEANMDFHRKGPHWQYMSSCNARVVRTTWDIAPSNTSVDFLGFYYRHTAPSPHLQNLRILQNIAGFGNPDYYVIGRLDNHRDRSAFPFVKRAFAYHKRHEALYEDMRGIADVLLIRGFRVHAEGEGMGTGGEGLGWVRMLTESHIPFQEAAFDLLEKHPEQIKRYRTVILCGYQAFTEKTADILDRFVEEGGTLILAGMTGLAASKKEGFPLRSAGIRGLLSHRVNCLSCMFEVTEQERPLFPSFADRDYVITGEEYAEYAWEENTEKYLRMTPVQPFGPPELCYTFDSTDFYGVYVHPYGKGKTITVPFLPGLIYHAEGFDNLFLYMRDLVRTFAGAQSLEAEPFTEMVEVTYGESPDRSRRMVHLINGTGHFGRSFFQPVPVCGIRLRVPAEKKPQALTLLTLDREPESLPFDWQDSQVLFTVEKLEDFAAAIMTF